MKDYQYLTEEDFRSKEHRLTPKYAAELANTKLAKLFKKGYTYLGDDEESLCGGITLERHPADTHTAHVFLQPIEEV